MTDLLKEMTQALSSEYDGATAAPEATRARVIRTLGERRPRRRKWMAIGIPAFVLFGGSTAWAAATGQLDHIVERAIAVIRLEPAAPAETVAKTAPPKPQQRAVPPPASDPVMDEDIEEKIEDPVPTPDTSAPVNLVPTQVRNTPPASTAASSAGEPDEAPPEEPGREESEEDYTALFTYRGAHRAQFSEGNCSRAIAGYNRYLQIAPDGAFSLEARYNRGVCLVRLGRHAEARTALQPFAQGTYGDYRRSQSRELLDALGANLDQTNLDQTNLDQTNLDQLDPLEAEH